MGHSYARGGLAGVESLHERGSTARGEASVRVERDGPLEPVEDSRAHVPRVVVLKLRLDASQASRGPRLHAIAARVVGMGEVLDEEIQALELAGVELRGGVIRFLGHRCASMGVMGDARLRDERDGSGVTNCRSKVQTRGHARRTHPGCAHTYTQ